MNIPFQKYHGSGNDFILIDNRNKAFSSFLNPKNVNALCKRHFGIGADGLIALQSHDEYDFEMLYFNADGMPGSMCGNGGRCATAYFSSLTTPRDNYHFLAIDGPHHAKILPNGWVALQMQNVDNITQEQDAYILDTGSPHYVVFVEDLTDIQVVENGQLIRYSDRFRKEGINVNFVEKQPQLLVVATYERGVEAETLSCGTGVTACALASVANQNAPLEGKVDIQTKGGSLSVQFKMTGQQTFSDIWLNGPAQKVFEGTITEVPVLPYPG